MTEVPGLSGAASMAIVYIVIYLLCIALSWWALQEFRFDLFLKKPRSAAAKLLQIFLSIALGHLVASFFVQYLNLSMGLKLMF
jgi:uncharacterized integral membrane protein (TIGR02327 family)